MCICRLPRHALIITLIYIPSQIGVGANPNPTRALVGLRLGEPELIPPPPPPPLITIIIMIMVRIPLSLVGALRRARAQVRANKSIYIST